MPCQSQRQAGYFLNGWTVQIRHNNFEYEKDRHPAYLLSAPRTEAKMI